ncbi:hypothetical protein SDC9_140638 [bioreactor metagenome]|uniref:Uncharacterized protein n=1 Tax=bioreactor metagenome TaxID=1076179 RepID=A0A645DVG4_9ZZZZ
MTPAAINFEANITIPLPLLHEKSNLGRQSTIIARIIVPTNELTRVWATRAHTPAPLTAIIMPIIPEITTAPIVELNNFLKIMFLVT